jgi:hypothetical protein
MFTTFGVAEPKRTMLAVAVPANPISAAKMRAEAPGPPEELTYKARNSGSATKAARVTPASAILPAVMTPLYV